MATTTPNFGWAVPTSTDLVKDGATAIETLGDSIDSSLVDLKGGSLDQVLAKNSATDMDFKWVTPSTGGGGANWTLLNSGGTTLSGAATISVGGISSKDKILLLVKDAKISTTEGWGVQFRLNADSGTKYNYSYTGINNPASYNVNTVGGYYAIDNAVNIGGSGSGTGSLVNGYALITGCNTSGMKVFQACGNGTAAGGGANNTAQFSNGFYDSTSTISSISVLTGVNFTSGTMFVYTSA